MFRRVRYIPEPYTYQYDPQIPVPPLQPWRDRFADVAVLPVALLRGVANPEELRLAGMHTDRLDVITRGYRDPGPLRPLTVNVDKFSHVVLADGHHRVLVAERLEIARLPVQFELVEHIRGWASPLGPFTIALSGLPHSAR